MVCLIILLFVYQSADARTHYVNNNNPASNFSGTSWVNSFISLQQAIDSAASGDTIKVALGTYRPPGSVAGAEFRLKSGVILLAGYSPATGDSTDNLRNWVNFPVVLSGTLNNGVIVDSLVTARNLTVSTVLDGFLYEEQDRVDCGCLTATGSLSGMLFLKITCGGLSLSIIRLAVSQIVFFKKMDPVRRLPTSLILQQGFLIVSLPKIVPRQPANT